MRHGLPPARILNARRNGQRRGSKVSSTGMPNAFAAARHSSERGKYLAETALSDKQEKTVVAMQVIPLAANCAWRGFRFWTKRLVIRAPLHAQHDGSYH